MDFLISFRELLNSLQAELVIVAIGFIVAVFKKNRGTNHIEKMKEYREVLEMLDSESRPDLKEIKEALDEEIQQDIENTLPKIINDIKLYSNVTAEQPNLQKAPTNILRVALGSIYLLKFAALVTSIAFSLLLSFVPIYAYLNYFSSSPHPWNDYFGGLTISISAAVIFSSIYIILTYEMTFSPLKIYPFQIRRELYRRRHVGATAAPTPPRKRRA